MLEIHNIVAAFSPDATVELRRYGVVYYDGSRGGPVSAGICQVLIRQDHLRLAFIHGAFLPDPHHLLRGSTFPKRYFPLPAFNEVPWEAIKEFIQAHIRFEARSVQAGCPDASADK